MQVFVQVLPVIRASPDSHRRVIASLWHIGFIKTHRLSRADANFRDSELGDIVMAMSTNLAGRIMHTVLPKSSALLPLFEAVVNAIHGIEESIEGSLIPITDGRIVIDIIRSRQTSLSEVESRMPPIEGFQITDNGVGFTNKNFDAFETLDTDNKLKRVPRCWTPVMAQGVLQSGDY